MEPTFRASMNWLHTWTGRRAGRLAVRHLLDGHADGFRSRDRPMDDADDAAGAAGDAGAARHASTADPRGGAAATAPSGSRSAANRPDADVPRGLGATPSGPVSAPISIPPRARPCLIRGPLAGTQLPLSVPLHAAHPVRPARLRGWSDSRGMAMLVAVRFGRHRPSQDLRRLLHHSGSRRKPRRLILDLHNVAGVLGLPFHIAITLSGLIIFYSVYLLVSVAGRLPGRPRAPSARKPSTSSTARRRTSPASWHRSTRWSARARAGWEGDIPRFVTVRNPGDAGAIVQVSRRERRSRAGPPHDVASFDGATGGLLHQRLGAQPMVTASALHQRAAPGPVPPLDLALALFRAGPIGLRLDRDRPPLLA